MQCGTYDITCDQYATFTLVITWNDTTGNPVDLTSYSALMDVENTPGGTLVISLSTSNSRITLGGTAGTITLNLSSTLTSALTAGAYYYDLILTDGSGNVTRLMEGRFVVPVGVTP